MPSDLDQPAGRRHVVVVGAGISGLAAAHALATAAPPRGGLAPRVTVLEATGQVGGKLRVSDVAGVPVDEGAEALLLRRPEAVAMAQAAGLGAELVPAATTAAAIWSRSAMRPLPRATVLGVPGDLRALATSGLLTARELARVPLDAWLPRTPMGADVAVGRYVAARLGRAVVDRVVEPLLGGVYAGRADELSLAATLPALVDHVRRERSLLAAARNALADRASDPVTAAADGLGSGAVFGGLPGGVGRLPAALAAASGADVRMGAVVRDLVRTPHGWRLVVGGRGRPEVLDADAVVLAVPAAPAARLLRSHAPAAAAELAGVRYASTGVVAVAFDARAFPVAPVGSGFLVPPVESRAVKAVTFCSTKWGWYAEQAPGLVVLRASVGRLGEQAVLQRADAEVVELVLADLADILGVTDPPLDARVTRWGGGLPQYAVGHLSLVARVRAAVAALPGLAVAGAAYDGVGVPACVATGQRAAAQVLRQWRS